MSDAVDRLPDEFWTETFERTPGGRVIRYAAIPGMRLREVEIHHVDLDAGFAPQRLVRRLLRPPDRRDGQARRRRTTSFRVLATDLATTWVIGDDPGESGTTVSGPAGDLAWWLTGRPAAESLTVQHRRPAARESVVT